MLVQGRGGWAAGVGRGLPGTVEDGRGLSKAAGNGEGRRGTVGNSGCEEMIYGWDSRQWGETALMEIRIVDLLC